MDSIKSSSREHPQTVQKPRNGKFLGLHGKFSESEYFNGTPDTQPETPDIFGLHSVESKNKGRGNDEHLIPLATCDENHFFSPIGRVAMNLNDDYDVESLGEGLDSPEAKETPESNKKSSKRRMFEALMAIAKSPVEKKKENTFNSKKDLMSALRGFAHTPEKKSDDSIEVMNSESNDNHFSCSVKDSNEALAPYKTPAKETCTSGIDILIQASPAKQVLDSNKSVDRIESSPDAKEILHLNTALESLKNKLYDDFDDSDSRVGSNALENYKAAVEKFRCMELQQKQHHGAQMLCSKPPTQSAGIDFVDKSPGQNEIELSLSAPQVKENNDTMHAKQDVSDSVPTKFAPYTLKLVKSITQLDPIKNTDTNAISPEKGDEDEKKNESFGSTDASPGIKTPSLREKLMLMGALLPDISPSKSEVVSVCGAESVASTVVTQKMSVVHASYLVASDHADKVVANPTINTSTSHPSHLGERKNETRLKQENLSPNLLDKANVSCEEDPLTPNLLDKADGSSPCQTEDNLSQPAEDPLTPNLLDKANDTPVRAPNSEVREKVITPNIFDKAESLHQRLQAVGTPNKLPEAYNDISDISYLPRQYGDTQNNAKKSTNRLQTSTPEKDELDKVLDNVIKLNLGPTLTNEILQSVKKCSRDLGAPSLGINQIDIDVDYDDHSEVSSLGTGSILSNVALSTLNALARKNPKEPIENIIRDFNRMQKMQNSTDFLAVDSLQYSPDTAHSPPLESAFPSNPLFRIQPPRADTKKGKDKRRYEMIYKQEKRFIPSIENGVLNDFEKLQKEVEYKSKQKITDQISALKVEKKQDFQHNQYLMDEFEKIENRDSSRQWMSKPGNFGTDTATRKKSNDEWLVNFEEPCDEKIEPLKGLLKDEKEEVGDAIEQKKLMYETIENSVHSDMDDEEDREIKKKKKKKKVLKKMAKLIKRKKKTHDEEGSIGIASLSTMNTAEDGKGKKNRFKFLKSLRRKKKKSKDTGNVCESSVMFDDDNIEEVSESFIVDNIDVVENDEAEVSYYSDCSEETSLASKNSCAYATLET